MLLPSLASSFYLLLPTPTYDFNSLPVCPYYFLPDPCTFSGHPDAKDADGNSALHCAAFYNKPDCLKLLLKGRASVGTGGHPPLKTTLWHCPHLHGNPLHFFHMHGAMRTSLDFADTCCLILACLCLPPWNLGFFSVRSRSFTPFSVKW